MRRFALRANVDRYRTLLAATDSDAQRGFLRQLLGNTEQELRGCSEIWKQTCPQLNIGPTFGHLLETQLDAFVQHQQASYGSLHLWDRATEALYLVAQSNFPWKFSQVFSVVRPGDGSVCERAADCGKSIFVEDVQTSNSFQILRPFASENGIHAIQSTPIASKAGELLAVVSTYFSEKNPFTGTLHDDCETMADQARSLLESSRWT